MMPFDLIKPEYSVISLFSAEFLGRNDVKHLKDLGCRDVTMVDLNGDKLMQMAVMYGYKPIVYDCFEFIKTPLCCDVIICDQWSNQDTLINIDHYETLCSIARKFVITGCTKDFLHLPGYYYMRSSHNGGTYWRVNKI